MLREAIQRMFPAVVFMLFLAALTPAQTVSPVIVEYADKANSRFQVYNGSDIPVTVVLDAHSFSVDSSGKAVFRKLDPGLHVQLSKSSFRLAPKETYYVFYKATSETYPNWFCIYSTFSGPVTSTGLKLAVELPHTVYLLGRKSIDRSDVSWNRADTSAEGGQRRVTAEIENHGAQFSRIQEVEVTSASGQQTFAGFPLFPGQRRDLELDWDQPGTPEHIVLKFQHFKLESKLNPISATR
jgi:hypothetical protein